MTEWTKEMQGMQREFAKELVGKKKPSFPTGGKVKEEEGEEYRIVICDECKKEVKTFQIGRVTSHGKICDKCLEKND